LAAYSWWYSSACPPSQNLRKKESGLQINLVPLPEGTTSALDALEAGYGDIAFAPNTGRFRDGISTVIPLYPSVLHIITDKDRPANSLEELLRGAIVYAGPQDSITRSLTNGIVNSLEFAPGEVTFTSSVATTPLTSLLYTRRSIVIV
jgi:TRAP-type uncharacterized transport system substrate-binding protein